jgi:hypothetical protein
MKYYNNNKVSILEHFTLVTVTTSNIFGIIPVYSLIKTQRYYGSLLVSCACIASIFMHATETKHGLSGLFLKQLSKTFLNIDRVLAIMTGVYGLYLFYTNPTKNLYQVILPIFGAMTSFIGEQTMNLPLYTLFHCIWHWCAYYGLYLVNH